MNSYKNKPVKSQNTSVANTITTRQNDTKTSFQLKDNRSEVVSQLKLVDVMHTNTTLQKKAPIQLAKGVTGKKQPGSKGDKAARGVGKATHSPEAEFNNGTIATFQSGSHVAASNAAKGMANRSGTTVKDVNQLS
ncbi:hypothetical protein [Kordia sp.]|uniref:hypothetical protein n=1 Tax=Kordia sp. TaxID=1965332 RepID=UPI0025BF576B|nr:hypothetical protein [Kordia sp.]MCH2193250.1 hypothetical protein [Kordia sp.]